MRSVFGIYAVSVLFGLCGLTGCNHNGGKAAPTGGMGAGTNWAADVRAFVAQAAGEEWTWSGRDTNLPASVRGLSPIRVTVVKQTTPALVEIKLSGGFLPHGYLVTCQSNVVYTNRLYGNGWEVKRVGDGVYEYRGL